MATALALLLAVLAVMASAADGRHITQPHPLPRIQCKSVPHEMSACKHFISARPGSNAAPPSAACCKAFSAALNDDRGRGSCLCYLTDDRNVLGFHVDRWHIASLFSCCTGFGSAAGSVSSFLKNCRGSKAPLHRPPPHDHDRVPPPHRPPPHVHDRVPPPHRPPSHDHDGVPLPHCHPRRYHDVPSPPPDVDLLPPSSPPKNPELSQPPPSPPRPPPPDADLLLPSPPPKNPELSQPLPSPPRDADILPPSPPPRNPDLRQPPPLPPPRNPVLRQPPPSPPPTSSDGDHLRLSPPRRGADNRPPQHLLPGTHGTDLGPTPADPPRTSIPQPKLNCPEALPTAQAPGAQPKPIWARPGLEPPIIVIAKGTVEDRLNRVQLLTGGLLFFLL